MSFIFNFFFSLRQSGTSTSNNFNTNYVPVYITAAICTSEHYSMTGEYSKANPAYLNWPITTPSMAQQPCQNS